MKVNRLNSRNTVFSFPELDQTNVLAIYGEKYTYLCDTFLGPDAMEEIKDIIKKDGRSQQIIVFNSHYDWDHVWGNCAFKDSIIVAHEKCRENLDKYFWEDFKKNSKFAKGEVVPCFPNLLFQEKLVFTDDDITFYYTPGHTEDSSTCFDKKTNTLFVGDNVENPHPYVQKNNIEQLINTLQTYIKLNPSYIITGHGKEGSLDLINTNIDYLKKKLNEND